MMLSGKFCWNWYKCDKSKLQYLYRGKDRLWKKSNQKTQMTQKKQSFLLTPVTKHLSWCMVISYFIVSILINQLDLFSSPPSSPPTATIVSEFLVCFVCLYHYMICNLVLVVKMHNSLSYNFHVYYHTFLVSKSVWYNHYIKDYIKVY